MFTEIANQSDHPARRVVICPQIVLSGYRRGLSVLEQQNSAFLAHFMQYIDSQQARWEAVECLWQTDPQHPALPMYKLLDLSLLL